VKAYQQIYEGRWTPQQIAEFDSRRLAALREILTQLTQTGVHVLLSTAIDPGFAPGMQATYCDPTGRARVSQAVDAFNSKLRLLASDVGVPVIDSNGLMQAIFGSAANPASVIWVGGVPLTHGQGNEPTWTFTANGICPGTVISGLWAGLVVEALNSLYNAGLPQLTVAEILERAGLGDRFNPRRSIPLLKLRPVGGTPPAFSGKKRFGGTGLDGWQSQRSPRLRRIPRHRGVRNADVGRLG
jgi:hypothetical protein